MNHDLFNEQPQQFRRQLRDIRVPLRLIKKAARSNRRFPQALDFFLFLWDANGDAALFRRSRMSPGTLFQYKYSSTRER